VEHDPRPVVARAQSALIRELEGGESMSWLIFDVASSS
jgi:hypothetical protein